MATRGYRFEVVKEKKQTHIRLFAGNNEIALSGENLHNEADAFSTIESICEGVVKMLRDTGGVPKYTTKSLKPKSFTDSFTVKIINWLFPR